MSWLLQDLVISTALACGVWAACRWSRLGPVARHALWMIVLVKLLVPPVVAWPWAIREPVPMPASGGMSPRGMLDSLLNARDKEPQRGAGASGTTAAAGGTVNGPSPVAANQSVSADSVAAVGASPKQNRALWTWENFRSACLGIWLLGAAAFATLQCVRIFRMFVRLRTSRPADDALARHIDAVARRLHMRPIRTRVVPGLGGPFVWALGRPLLLWPAELSSAGAGAAGLIAHELAHVKRRDHWVGWMELLAGCVWWWNPLYWYTCRQLRENAELACDAWVVAEAGEARRTYAEALLAVCATMTRGAPLPAVGVTSGGKQILEQRLTMIMRGGVSLRLPRLGLAAVVAVALAALPAWSQQGTPTKVPFTLSPETTRISAPLHADGMPDYVAALNEKYGSGVTPENNGFVLWASMALHLGPRERWDMEDQILTRARIKPAPADVPVWMDYTSFLIGRKKMEATDPKLMDKYDEMHNLRDQLWTADQYPDVAAYLKSVDKQLAIAEQATNRSRWWVPTMSFNQRVNGLGPSPCLNYTQDVANVLSVRATLRAKAGDFDGFLRDVMTIKSLSRQWGRDGMLIDHLVGRSIDQLADTPIATVAGSGILTQPQCATLRQALASLPALGGLAENVDFKQRWELLEEAELVATGQTDVVGWQLEAYHATTTSMPSNPGDDWWEGQQAVQLKVLKTIDRAAVDWNAVLRRMNQFADDMVAIVREPTLAGMRRRNTEFNTRMLQWRADGAAGLAKRENESQADYSERVADVMMACWWADEFSKDEVKCRWSPLYDDMIRVLLAAAEAKARTGTWPAKAEDLVPAFLPELPRDIYSPDGRDPLKYRLTDTGPRVYSIGENGRDDGGRRGENGADDIGLGPG